MTQDVLDAFMNSRPASWASLSSREKWNYCARSQRARAELRAAEEKKKQDALKAAEKARKLAANEENKKNRTMNARESLASRYETFKKLIPEGYAERDSACALANISRTTLKNMTAKKQVRVFHHSVFAAYFVDDLKKQREINLKARAANIRHLKAWQERRRSEKR